MILQLFIQEKHETEPIFKKSHDYSLTQLPKPVLSKMCVGFCISTCLHYLEMVINIQYGNSKPFICA